MRTLQTPSRWPGLSFAQNTGGGVLVASGGGSEGEPTFASTGGTIFLNQNATVWDGLYADITAMGNDNSSACHIVPQPSPVTTGGAVVTAETTLVSGGRLATGKIPRMHFPGTDQTSATFQTLGTTGADGVIDYLTYYFRWTMPLGWNGNRVNVKNIESWPGRAIDGGRTQINTRNPLSGNPDPAACCFECLVGIEVDQDSQQTRGPHPDQFMFDGNWHRFTQALKSSSSIGAHDGFQRAWVDGIRIIDLSWATINVVPADSPYGKKWCTPLEYDRFEKGCAASGSGCSFTDGGYINNHVFQYWWGSVQTNNPDHSQDTNPWTYDLDNVVGWYV